MVTTIATALEAHDWFDITTLKIHEKWGHYNKHANIKLYYIQHCAWLVTIIVAWVLRLQYGCHSYSDNVFYLVHNEAATWILQGAL